MPVTTNIHVRGRLKILLTCTDSAKQCTQKIKNLATGIKDKFRNSKIGISGLTWRQDTEVAPKVQEVNKELKQEYLL